MKNILYLTYDGLTDPLGQSQIIPYLIGLANRGFKIDVISCEKPAMYQLRGQEIEALLKKNNIHWTYVRYHKSPPVISSIWDLLLIKKRAFALHSTKKYSIVHCRSYLTALVGLSLKYRKNLKLVFDMRGFWAEERIEGKIWNIDNPVYKIIYNYFKKKEKELLINSDHIITLTQKASEIIKKGKLGYTVNTPITSIPCCVDTTLFDYRMISADVIQAQKKAIGLDKDAFVLGYIGSLGTWYMLDEMMDFFSSLLSLKPNAVFLFLTREAPETILQVSNAKAIPANKIKIVQSERKDIPSKIALLDLSIFFIRPTLSKKASSPTKHAEVMAMGIPVICNTGIGDTDYVVNTYNCGWLSEEFSADNYVELCKKIINSNPDSLAIREGAEHFYSLEKGIDQYEHVYNSI